MREAEGVPLLLAGTDGRLLRVFAGEPRDGVGALFAGRALDGVGELALTDPASVSSSHSM